MRLTLEIRNRVLTVGFDKTDEAPPFEPQPAGSQCGDLERAPRWDHDNKEPIGFKDWRTA